MRIDVTTGRLVGAGRFVASDNCDHRPARVDVDTIIIHAISLPPESFGGDEVEAFFCNRLDCTSHPYFECLKDSKVSAHFFVRRDAQVIQFVPAHRRAWHAGESLCDGRADVNDFSVGIELEGSDHVPFEAAQYTTLAALTRALFVRFRAITPARIFGHNDVAPGRKTDPGPYFQWARYRRLLENHAR